jgi:hypothetical protein
MNRSQIVRNLINEGFSSDTLVGFSDKQLINLHERIVTTAKAMQTNPDIKKMALDPNTSVEVKEGLKGGQKKLDKNHNGKIDAQDFKMLRAKKSEVKEDLKGNQKKIDKNHNGKIDAQDFKILRGKKSEVKEDEKWIQKAIHPSKEGSLKKALGVKKGETIPDSKLKAAEKKGGKIGQRARLASTLKKLKEHSEAQDFVNSLVEGQYHSLTTKNEIMDMIKTKLNEQETMTPMPKSKPKLGHNGVPEFMTYNAIKNSGSPSVAPSKPKVAPGTKPTSPSKPKKTPFNPGPKIEPKPKAMKENSPSVAPSKPKVAPGTKPTSPSKPKKTPFNPGPKIEPKPKAKK